MMGVPAQPSTWAEQERRSRDQIASEQLDALRRQLEHVAERSAHYAARFAELGFEAGDLREFDDLEALPITGKAEYLAGLEARPPWGTFLAADLAQVRRVHYSSGTTAQPCPMFWTAHDLERWSDLYARSAASQGVGADDVYQCLFSFSWFVGGLGAIAGYQRLGATCIPGGSVDSERQVETMFRYGTTAVGGTPSFMIHLSEVGERMGRDLRDSRVARVMVGGEPGAGIPATRELIEDLWGARCFDGYGSLEFQPIAWECEAQSGGHLMEDFLYAEVLDPDTMREVPDGEPGVLVLTHLDKEACPLVRWWTGDVVVRTAEVCECGRTHARLCGGVRGRADDMFIVRGVNVFPSAIEQVVRATPGTTGEYVIVLDEDVRDPRTGWLDAIKVRVELHGDSAAEVAESLRRVLKVRAVVDPVPPGALPRSEHKARRVVEE